MDFLKNWIPILWRHPEKPRLSWVSAILLSSLVPPLGFPEPPSPDGSTASQAAPQRRSQGYRLVQDQAPKLYELIEEILGSPEQASSFFQEWTEKDVRSIVRSLERLAKGSAAKNTQAKKRETARWVFSKLGEILGAAHIMMKYHLHHGSRPNADGLIFMKEYELRAEYPFESRPDGILYKIETKKWKRTLTILKVFESKMGASSFDPGQAQGYFEEWKKKGLRIHDEEFKSKQIVFELPSRGPTSAAKTSFEDFKNEVLALATTRGGQRTPGNYHIPEEPLRGIAATLAENAHLIFTTAKFPSTETPRSHKVTRCLGGMMNRQ